MSLEKRHSDTPLRRKSALDPSGGTGSPSADWGRNGPIWAIWGGLGADLVVFWWEWRGVGSILYVFGGYFDCALVVFW